jgi:hypothetical protein
MLAALVCVNEYDSARGPIMIDPERRDIVQNEYLRRADRVDGQLRAVELAKFRWSRNRGRRSTRPSDPGGPRGRFWPIQIPDAPDFGEESGLDQRPKVSTYTGRQPFHPWAGHDGWRVIISGRWY